MRVWQIINQSLEITRVPIPKPKTDEVLIKVAAIGINRADILQRQGLYPAVDNSNIPGLEIAGIDCATGSRVMALIPGGGYAEYVVAPLSATFPMPDDLDFISAAALPEALATSYMALQAGAGLQPGDERGPIIIHGGSSGVGHLMLQIAKYIQHSPVYASSSSEEKQNFCRSLGADFTFSYHQNKWQEILPTKVNLIIDILGAPHLSSNIKALAYGGAIIVLACMGGSSDTLPIGALLMKNISIKGMTLRSHSMKHIFFQLACKEYIPAILSRKIKIILHNIFPFESLHSAHQNIECGHSLGKVVLTLNSNERLPQSY